MPRFRLDRQPWIPVQRLDGAFAEVSLTAALREAPQVRRLLGNPLEVAVLHRMLLAVLHRALGRIGSAEWGRHWQDRSAALKLAAAYVEEHGDQFDLYDSQRPWLQHPALAPGDKPGAVLLYDRAQGNNPVFLDASHEEDPNPVPSSQIARGLLVSFAFGGSHPDKSNPLSTGKENTMYAGPLCARLVVLLEGEDLARTLLLNLLTDEKPGRPGWERPPAEKPGRSEPEGICDRYTRATRFVRLKPSEDGEFCLSVALHMGEQLADDEEVPRDPMIPLYLAADKKLKVQRMEPGRALWRSAHVLLNSRIEPTAVPARTLECVLQHLGHGSIDEEERVRMRILGVAGSAQGPKTDLWRDESLPFQLSVIADERAFADLVQAVKAAEVESQTLRKRLFGFAMRFLQAAAPNVKPDDAQKLVDEIAPNLAEYWAMVSPRGERLATGRIDGDEWAKFVQGCASEAFDRAVAAIPPSARRLQAQFSSGRTERATTKPRKGETTNP